MKAEYKDYDIYYDEDKNVWRCGDLGVEKESLKKVKEAITKFIAHEMKAKSVVAIHDGYSGFETVTVTSFPDKSYAHVRDEAWIKNEQGSRSKVYISSLYENSAENKRILKEIQTVDKDIERSEKRKKALCNKLKHLPKVVLK